MANVNEIYMTVRWKSDASGNRPDFETPKDCAWEDITGQPADKLPCTPNVYLIRARVTDAVLTVINGDARFIVLARRTWDDKSPETVAFDNFSAVPTGPQLTTLKNTVIARYPGVDEAALTEAGQAVFRAGLTREQIVMILAVRWQRFLKAVS